MVGLNVLQLMTDAAGGRLCAIEYTILVITTHPPFIPAALNYGLFRQVTFNDTPQYIMLYDMGAASTTATIVGMSHVSYSHVTNALLT